MSRLAALAAGAWLLAGCTTDGPDYQPNRHDYWSFRERVGALPEPNYLPWVMHRERLPDGSEALVACRWPDSAFPLRYFAPAPELPDVADGEERIRPASDYVAAVDDAFAVWQRAIGPPLRFERALQRLALQ